MIKKKQNLNKEYLNKEYFFPKGRDAFFEALKILRLRKKDKILIPGYIGLSKKEGSGVFDPIKKLGVGYEFYKLNEDLSANEEDFKKKVKIPRIKAVLAIHYFGFCQKDFELVVEQCKKHKKYLIEDCAHAFNSFYKGKRLGEYGDICFYSIHKFLAADDGGIMVINNEKLAPLKKIKENVSPKTLITLYKSDIEKISKTRRKNYNYILNNINRVKLARPFYGKLCEGIVPLNFPIIIEKKDRNDVYFKLLHKGIETVSLYHTLIPQIKKEEYPISANISDHILNLPIHEDISIKDMDSVIKELKNIIEHGQVK
jgi:dTDP-4-amino-4,6-dideoxygalactose transaminase